MLKKISLTFILILSIIAIKHLSFGVLPAIVFKQNSLERSSLSGGYDYSVNRAVFNNKGVNIPEVASNFFLPLNVLGDSTETKRIFIDLTNQRLYAYEGNKQVYNFLISSGKWGRTPTGVFRIWTKLRYTTMSGGSLELGNYYYLPNVPYTMYFYNDKVERARGYGIHGTYWHDNFGHPMSHGCINMKTEEVSELYQWAEPNIPENRASIRATEDNFGTEIIIYGIAPWS